jgi:two-component system, OmpR family, sensor histidine kinase VicK
MSEINNLDVFRELTSKVLFSYNIDAASITFLNNAFSIVWKRTRESAINDPGMLFETIHPDDRMYVAKEYKELLNGIIKDALEFRILLPDKTQRWVAVHPHLFSDDNGKKCLAGFVSDIDTLKDNIHNLERFAAKKNSILEILSHDLAGPLANIQALTEALGSSTEAYGNVEINNLINIIRESSSRSIRLIRDLVQQEFLESANSGMVKRRVDVVYKIEEVIEQYRAGEDHIQKEFIFTSSSDQLYAYIDDGKLMQVLNNLISNSIKFTHDDGLIAIDLSEKEESFLITIKDNGIGIPKRYHAELFDKFTKARREGLRGEPSTGLGMSIIKTIVNWHNGKIWFESEENKGTVFYIEIPIE